MHMNMEHRASFFSSVYQDMNSLTQLCPKPLGGGSWRGGGFHQVPPTGMWSSKQSGSVGFKGYFWMQWLHLSISRYASWWNVLNTQWPPNYTLQKIVLMLGHSFAQRKRKACYKTLSLKATGIITRHLIRKTVTLKWDYWLTWAQIKVGEWKYTMSNFIYQIRAISIENYYSLLINTV